ncbi:hypothetical protein Q5752_004830 [Cryptotrichosporon argae]
MRAPHLRRKPPATLSRFLHPRRLHARRRASNLAPSLLDALRALLLSHVFRPRRNRPTTPVHRRASTRRPSTSTRIQAYPPPDNGSPTSPRLPDARPDDASFSRYPRMPPPPCIVIEPDVPRVPSLDPLPPLRRFASSPRRPGPLQPPPPSPPSANSEVDRADAPSRLSTYSTFKRLSFPSKVGVHLQAACIPSFSQDESEDEKRPLARRSVIAATSPLDTVVGTAARRFWRTETERKVDAWQVRVLDAQWPTTPPPSPSPPPRPRKSSKRHSWTLPPPLLSPGASTCPKSPASLASPTVSPSKSPASSLRRRGNDSFKHRHPARALRVAFRPYTDGDAPYLPTPDLPSPTRKRAAPGADPLACPDLTETVELLDPRKTQQVRFAPHVVECSGEIGLAF